MRWSRSPLLMCQQGHRWNLVAASPLPERDGRLICPRCTNVLTVDVPARPDELEFRAYPRLLRKVLLICLLYVPLAVLGIWLSVSRSRILAVVDAPNGLNFAVSRASVDGDREVYLVDAATGQRTSIVRGKRMSGPLVFSPGGQMLAVAVSEPESQPRPGDRDSHIVGVIQLWDLAQKRQQAVLRGHLAPIVALAFTRDGRSLFSADKEYQIKRWDVESGREEVSHKSALAFQRMALSPDGRILAIGNTSGMVALLDTSTWRRMRPLGVAVSSSAIAGLAFSLDGRTLATAGALDQQVKLWDPANGMPRATIAVLADWLTCLAFSPDGQTLAVATGSFTPCGAVKLFDLPSGRERLVLPVGGNTVTSVAFSADGQTMIAGSGFSTSLLSSPHHGEVYRWDVKTGRLLARGIK